MLLPLLLLRCIIVFLGGTATIATAAGAATVAVAGRSNMLPAGRIVAVVIGVAVAVVRAINASLDAGRAALPSLHFGNVYVSHNEC